MSFNSTASTQATSFGSQNEYLEGSRRVQQIVHQIQQHASVIRKEASKLSGATAVSSEGKQKVECARASAKLAEDDARKLLANFPVDGNAGEQNMRRLARQKLGEGLSSACADLENASKAYTAADIEREKRVQQAAAVTDGEADGLELGGPAATSRAQQTLLEEDVADAEVELHTVIVNEFSEEVSRVARDIQTLHRTMGDLAKHSQEQGESINNIESQMSYANASMQGANEQLVTTSRAQNRNNKFIYAAVVISIIAAGTIIYVVAKNH